MTTLHYIFRSMRERDLPSVHTIERNSYDFPWSVDIFRSCLYMGHSCYVADNGAGVLGYGLMALGGGEAHILNLSVQPQRRRSGIGRALLCHLLMHAAMRGSDDVLLEVRPSNTAALRMYLAAGFRPTAVRRGYYPGTAARREDAVVLARPAGVEFKAA